MMVEGWPQDHKPNGHTDHTSDERLIQQIDLIRQGQLLREAILRLGRPAEIHLSKFLAEGQMYIVDTSVATDMYEAEAVGRLLIVHNGMAEDARALKETLDRALEEEDGSH